MKLKLKEVEFDLNEPKAYVPRFIKGKLYVVELEADNYQKLLFKVNTLLHIDNEMFMLIYNNLSSSEN